jgi:RNA polymerase sigma-70 factor, ECF subfamily
MAPADPGAEQPRAAAARLDPDSAEWLRVLAGTGPQREAALARLHEMLVRIARGEVGRRGPGLRLAGPELDDLAYQVGADALIAITAKLGQFRGKAASRPGLQVRHLGGIGQDRPAPLAQSRRSPGCRGLGSAA